MGKPLFSFLLVTADHLQLLMSKHRTLFMFRSAVRRPQAICCGFGVLSSRCFTRGLTCDSIVKGRATAEGQLLRLCVAIVTALA